MKLKQKCKIALDVCMTLLLFVLMAYQITGQLAHEWVGAAMFLCFIAHHILNARWAGGLLKGTYNGFRIFQTAIDLLLLADMLTLMVSGIQMSRYVFAFLPGFGSIATARRLHMLASYWGFALMSVHLGLHWGMVTGMFRKVRVSKPSPARTAAAWGVAGLIGAYGVYAFWRNQIWMYLFLRAEFVFFDYSQSPVRFFLDYLAMMGLFVFLTYGAVKLLRRKKKAVQT